MAGPDLIDETPSSCALCAAGPCTGACAGVAPPGAATDPPAAALRSAAAELAAGQYRRDVPAGTTAANPYLRVNAGTGDIELVTVLDGGGHVVNLITRARARDLADALTWAAFDQEGRDDA